MVPKKTGRWSNDSMDTLGYLYPFLPIIFGCWIYIVQVQSSSRHIEDHIQDILVLKCSSKGFAHP
jgi:hypothetical protein